MCPGYGLQGSVCVLDKDLKFLYENRTDWELTKMTSRCKSRRQFASKAKTSVFTVCNRMRNFLIVIYFTKENFYWNDSYGATSTATDQAAFIKGRAFLQGVNFNLKSSSESEFTGFMNYYLKHSRNDETMSTSADYFVMMRLAQIDQLRDCKRVY